MTWVSERVKELEEFHEKERKVTNGVGTLWENLHGEISASINDYNQRVAPMSFECTPYQSFVFTVTQTESDDNSLERKTKNTIKFRNDLDSGSSSNTAITSGSLP